MWKPVSWSMMEGKTTMQILEIIIGLPSSPSSNGNSSLRSFWDGGLLANTPLRQTILAHRDYWHHSEESKR